MVDNNRHVLNYDEQAAVFSGLRERLPDPKSVQVRSLRRSTNGVGFCGELNFKNQKDDYDGFGPIAGAILDGRAALVFISRENATKNPPEIKAVMEKMGC